VESLEAVHRRDFLRVAGVSAAALSLPGLARATDAVKTAKAPKPAEALVKELFAGLNDEQKKAALYAFDHGTKDGKGTPTRLRMFNAPLGKPIKDVYTKTQWELIERILKAISSGDDGYNQLSRDGGFDASGTLENCGAYIFGDPTDGKPFAWVFTGHHLTVRCDGNTTDGIAFGGPIYYGHSPNGYSKNNVFFGQTEAVISVFDALSEAQRKQAIVGGSPGEHEASIQFRKKGEAHPGIAFAELSQDQKNLVEKVMRTVLAPYRKEDTDEVMDIIKATGGMEKIHLAFYKDKPDAQKWHFWRLEGPGFVWNFRVLPHVHTYVSISSKIG
jgi:hypothetical protein